MTALLAESSFELLDWCIVGGYLLVVVALGAAVARRRGSDDFFLAGRSMPMWAVAISVLATSQSAATFVGGPASSYRSDLTYLSGTITASLLAAVLVAAFFIPGYYRRNVTSIYEVLGHDVGSTAQRAASGMFMIGRVFASGARLFIVAIPFSIITYGDSQPQHLIISIAIITVVAAGYTMLGGIRAVIWTDVLQAVIYISTITVALWLLWERIPLSAAQIIDALSQTDVGGRSKLTVVDTSSGLSFDPDRPASPYAIWPVLFGLTLLNLAAFGMDQDLVQRSLTCRSAARGAWSMIIAQLIALPVVALFLLFGLLLFIFYDQPHLMGEGAPGYAIDTPKDVFVTFIAREMPTGVRGLMIAGLFAAAMSSMDSALNAMASTTIADFVRPLRRRRRQHFVEPGELEDDRIEPLLSRQVVAFWAAMLGGFAVVCVYWQQATEVPILDFALGVMTFAYSGLLGVFTSVLFLRRGSNLSVAAALGVGMITILAFQPFMLPGMFGFSLAFGWQMLIASALALLTCAAGGPLRMTWPGAKER